MDTENLIKEWKEFGDITPPTSQPSLDEPIDMSQPLKVYWAPGCTGCMNMKDFLTRHGVEFVSINALADKQAFEELGRIGVKRVPIAARGRHWVDGQVIRDLAQLAGIKLEPQSKLSPGELVDRGNKVMNAALRIVAQIHDGDLRRMLPGRPRSYRQLAGHIFQIYELFLDLAEKNQRLEFAHFLHDVPASVLTSSDLVGFGRDLRERFNNWWKRQGTTTDFDATANVYYGNVTMHEFLERSVWHSAQHTRQLQVIAAGLGVPASEGLSAVDIAGLPMPETTYDDQIKLLPASVG